MSEGVDAHARVVVIGGGVAGLVAALEAARLGSDNVTALGCLCLPGADRPGQPGGYSGPPGR